MTNTSLVKGPSASVKRMQEALEEARNLKLQLQLTYFHEDVGRHEVIRFRKACISRRRSRR